MPTLHVRNIPEDLYRSLQEQAAAESRSLSAQVVMLLQAAVRSAEHRQSQADLLGEIRRRRFHPPAGAPDGTSLLREDRER